MSKTNDSIWNKLKPINIGYVSRRGINEIYDIAMYVLKFSRIPIIFSPRESKYNKDKVVTTTQWYVIMFVYKLKD